MLISNRRNSTRMGTIIPCVLQYPNFSGSDSWGTILDFSLSGVQLKSYFSFFPQQKVVMSFFIRDRYEFKNVEGHIIWVKQEGDYFYAGIEFASSLPKEKVAQAMHYMI